MKINPNKTQMVCISHGGSSNTAYIKIDDNKRITSDLGLKICGFRFGPTPDVWDQVYSMETKFNQRIWALRNLKRSGFTKVDLKTSYLSLVRPVFDYTSAVYHSLLSSEQSSRLERMQKQAVKIICGQNSNYSTSIEELCMDKGSL